MAHDVGVSVEGELGCLGSLETGEAGEEDGSGAEGKLTHDMLLTDPVQAEGFRGEDRRRCAGDRDRHQPWRLQVHTQADWRHPGDEPHRRDPRSDSVDASRHARLVQRAAGVAGDHPQVRRHIKETYGVPVEEIQRGIKTGVRKINIDTDIRLAMTGAIRKSFAEFPSEFDPRKALIAAAQGRAGLCKARFEAFGCAGMAPKIKPVPLEVLAKRYH